MRTVIAICSKAGHSRLHDSHRPVHSIKTNPCLVGRGSGNRRRDHRKQVHMP